MTHAIYFDRDPGKLIGRLTLQRVTANGEVVQLFKHLPVASGQFPFLDGGAEDWVTGKGATPFGEHWMSTKKESLTLEPVGTPFYPIGTKKGARVIEGPNGKHRVNVGLHLENDKPGTSGCCALLTNTPERECLAWALFTYLDHLHKYEPHIRFIVL
jgi:hypothetical protein